MGLFRETREDRAEAGIATTDDLKGLGGLGGLVAGLGGLSQMGPAVDRIAAAYASQAMALADIAEAVKVAEFARKAVEWQASGMTIVLPAGTAWETLAIVNTGATILSVQIGADPFAFPVPAAAGGVAAVGYFPVGGVQSVTVSGQTAAVFGLLINRPWPHA